MSLKHGQCRAKDPTSCKVHGNGSLYERLEKKANRAIDAQLWGTYADIRDRMDAMDDNHEKALEFFNSGKVPALDKVEGAFINFMGAVADLADPANADRGEPLEKDAEVKKDAEGLVSAGVEMIADRHEKEIRSDIGGNTVAWSDMNPFKNPFKNGKLR